MPQDKIGTTDSVSVGIERTPPRKTELLCPECGGPTIPAEKEGWRTCIDPSCLHSCAKSSCITGLN